MTDTEFIKYLADCGYPNFDPLLSKLIGDGFYIHSMPLIGHWTVIVGHTNDTGGFMDKWCMRDVLLSMVAVKYWPIGEGAVDHEPEGWHKHLGTGRYQKVSDGEYIKLISTLADST